MAGAPLICAEAGEPNTPPKTNPTNTKLAELRRKDIWKASDQSHKKRAGSVAILKTSGETIYKAAQPLARQRLTTLPKILPAYPAVGSPLSFSPPPSSSNT
jgi:hypothetical protein